MSVQNNNFKLNKLYKIHNIAKQECTRAWERGGGGQRESYMHWDAKKFYFLTHKKNMFKYRDINLKTYKYQKS